MSLIFDYEELITKLKTGKQIQIIDIIEIQYGKQIKLSNDSCVNWFTSKKVNVQGKNFKQTEDFLNS